MIFPEWRKETSKRWDGDYGFLKIDTNGNLRFTLQYLEIDKTVWNKYVFRDYLKRGYFLWQKATHS